ncbi:2-succinyl-6-hydroxy-2,4-cyclohexadiene-1-carboxylate synthase [bioreactor metagenome]|jgi:pimeloyl-ACP methyl ester carboxylesterase|uniref:2-succinyl-6-hydroxy-2, 4-cyclohexadiene-1-carboxylate synthase n=1 Tax=bioreactor metagenome TaxID=1076179 RepID=A0A644SPN8_9ZZZZ
MLHHEISGNGKKPLVLLHGFMENTTIWDEMEVHLSKDFTLIKIDLPGHGKSKVYQEIHPVELMAEKVKEVIDALKLEKINLLGHSLGGYVSLAFAEKFPEILESMTLFFSTTLADDEEKKEIRRRSIAIIDENFETFIKTSIPNLFSNNEKDILEGKIELAKNIAKSTDKEGVKAAQLGMAERPDRTEILENLDAKILIIAGKYDNAVKTENLLKIIPEKTNIKTYVLDCGHNGHWEKPTICAEIINTELLHNLPKHFLL